MPAVLGLRAMPPPLRRFTGVMSGALATMARHCSLKGQAKSRKTEKQPSATLLNESLRRGKRKAVNAHMLRLGAVPWAGERAAARRS